MRSIQTAPSMSTSTWTRALDGSQDGSPAVPVFEREAFTTAGEVPSYQWGCERWYGHSLRRNRWRIAGVRRKDTIPARGFFGANGAELLIGRRFVPLRRNSPAARRLSSAPGQTETLSSRLRMSG